jgi:NADH:ubiquinone oxidoreductase subunit F (NADH-binding)
MQKMSVEVAIRPWVKCLQDDLLNQNTPPKLRLQKFRDWCGKCSCDDCNPPDHGWFIESESLSWINVIKTLASESSKNDECQQLFQESICRICEGVPVPRTSSLSNFAKQYLPT